MTNPTNLARAFALGIVVFSSIAMASCGANTEAIAAQLAQSEHFQRLAATRSPGAPSDEMLANLRECESKGNYAAVSRSGTYRGAYQFSQRTWNNVAGSVLPSYLNADPATAPAYVQDAFARALWKDTGPRSWPVCGYRV